MFPTPSRTDRFLPAVLCMVAGVLAASVAAADAEVPPAEPRAPLRAQQVRPGLHVLSSAGGNVAVWSGPDTPQLLAAIAKHAPGPVRFVVNTHWHPDHTGGNEALGRSGAVLIAHDNVRARLGETQFAEGYDLRIPAAPKAAWPVVTFADALTLHLNGDNLVVSHVDDAHTDGDAIVWWEYANVVHLGDLFYNGTYPFIDLDSGGSLAGVVAAIELALARADGKTVVIPGHGPVSNRAELASYRDMLVAVGRRVRELVEDGRSEQEILAARPTAEFDERYGKGDVTPDRFVALVYADLTSGR